MALTRVQIAERNARHRQGIALARERLRAGVDYEVVAAQLTTDGYPDISRERLRQVARQLLQETTTPCAQCGGTGRVP